MDIETFAQLDTGDVFLYLAGGAALIATPPLVGIIVVAYLFRVSPNDDRSRVGRVFIVIAIVALVTLALGVTGITLLQPASPDIMLALLIMIWVFGLFGAGKLYWRDENRSK